MTDQRYQGLLNRLREGNCTDSDVEMLNNRVIGNFSGAINTFENNRIVTPGNELVMAINQLFASRHAQDHKLLVTTAKDTIGKRKLPAQLSKKIRDFPSTWTKGLPGELPMYVGMPVFLTKNIATELGLTNGTTGIIKSIHIVHGPDSKKVQFSEPRCLHVFLVVYGLYFDAWVASCSKSAALSRNRGFLRGYSVNLM